MRWLVQAQAVVVIALLGLVSSACTSGLDERRSISLGSTTRGRIFGGKRLAYSGPGYRQPARWRARERRYGTGELVNLIRNVAARLHRVDRGSVLAVADMSRRGGGYVSSHRSHASGRDADLVFFQTDLQGRPVLAEQMVSFNKTGASRAGLELRFDDRRNWNLIRALLVAPEAQVQYVFVDENIKTRLLAHAVARGEDPQLVARASDVLRFAGRRAPHDDHFHVRIYCSSRDRVLGCKDFGAEWDWRKKKLQPLVAKKWKPGPPLPTAPTLAPPLVAERVTPEPPSVEPDESRSGPRPSALP